MVVAGILLDSQVVYRSARPHYSIYNDLHLLKVLKPEKPRINVNIN